MQILLVEDDADLRDALAEHLRSVGATVVAASSVKAALSALADAQFDLLVSDLGLPDGSGYEVATAARDGNRVRAALALTGERGENGFSTGFSGRRMSSTGREESLEKERFV